MNVNMLLFACSNFNSMHLSDSHFGSKLTTATIGSADKLTVTCCDHRLSRCRLRKVKIASHLISCNAWHITMCCVRTNTHLKPWSQQERSLCQQPWRA